MNPIDQWILDHAYEADDIVLGDQGLTDGQLPDLHELLDLARPGWRDLFKQKHDCIADDNVGCPACAAEGAPERISRSLGGLY